MKVCLNCKKECEDDALKCENCGGTEFENRETLNDNINEFSNEKLDNNKEILIENNGGRKSRFKILVENLTEILSSRKVLFMLCGGLLLLVLGCIYFAIQIKLFRGSVSIYGACVIIEVIFALLTALCLGLLVWSIVVNVKYMGGEKVISDSSNADENEDNKDNKNSAE